MKILYLDFDGVIVDSRKECFDICINILIEKKIKNIDLNNFMKFFYKYRYLVNPPYDYFLVCNFYQESINRKNFTLTKKKFLESRSKLSQDQISKLSKKFFYFRKKLQQTNLSQWYKKHSLTFFAKKINNNNNFTKIIISTKNTDAIKSLCSYFNFHYDEIYGYEFFSKYQSKAGVINSFTQNNQKMSYFIDDSYDHLISVHNNTNVNCIFAHWGYGKNYSIFPLLNLKKIKKNTEILEITSLNTS